MIEIIAIVVLLVLLGMLIKEGLGYLGCGKTKKQ
jgi:hypothetical protein